MGFSGILNGVGGVVSVGLLLVITSACQVVFPREAPSCPAEDPGPDNQDFDRDLVDNGADNCPLVLNPDQADEDHDGVGDLCDLCPVGIEVNDADCDGVGDSCDPDNTRPDRFRFVAFNGSDDLELFSSVELVGGTAHMFPDPNTPFGLALTKPLEPIEGVFETRFQLDSFDESEGFSTIEIRFGFVESVTPNVGYYAWLLYTPNDMTVARLSLGTVTDADSTMYNETMATTTADFVPGTYTLRVTVVGTSARADLFTPGGSLITVDDPMLIDRQLGSFGVIANHADVNFEYVSHVGPI